MSTNTLHVTVESTADFFAAARADVRAVAAGEATEDRYVLSLPDEAALERLMRARTLELLRTIATTEPESIRELARRVDRDVKNVSTTLVELEDLGLVRFEQDGRAKRPVVWYDAIDVDIPLGSADATVSAD